MAIMGATELGRARKYICASQKSHDIARLREQAALGWVGGEMEWDNASGEMEWDEIEWENSACTVLSRHF